MDGEPRPRERRRRAERGWRDAPSHGPRGSALTDIGAAWSDGSLVVSGNALTRLLAVAPASAVRLGSALIPTAGSWKRGAEEARFAPRFTPVAGTELVVLGRDSADETWRELARIHMPEVDAQPTTVVESIDPGADIVPENLLRFTVTFSSSMDEGSAAGRIRLLDETGAVVTGALLDMPPELWDRERRRLTVLLEPGRIKRGLQPNVLAGAPLREGGVVTLEIDAGIRDFAGIPLAAGARRSYRVEPALRSRVDPEAWDVHWPDAENATLVIRFDRPLDRALVRRYLRPVDADGEPVPGTTSLDRDASVWTFVPAHAANDLRLRVDARLEDLAGNSVRRVFDRDLDRAEDGGITEPEVILNPGA